jgi:putative phage-type endonuclease
MNVINAPQGSDEWLAARAKCFTASEAPAMMGASKYQTRTELLRQKHTGIAADVDENKQRLFDRGHEAEAAARYIAEDIVGDDLSPLTGLLEVDGLPLLASFDGVTQGRDIVWETKLWNASLADAVRAGQLDPHYYWQLEQQLLVSGAERAYFTCTDGTSENMVGMWYESLPDRRASLIAGWKQFALDLANYQHVEVAERPAAEVSIELPALFIQAKGQITDSNMVAYGEALKTKLAEVRAIALVNDQDFSNAKASAAMLREQIKKLALTKEAMLAQTLTIGEAARMMDAWSEDMRLTALKLEKDVEREDAAKKAAIVSGARSKFEDHIKALNVRLGGQYMPANRPNLAEAIKGKRNYGSMTDAVDAMLANAKVEADMMADRIELNRNSLLIGTENDTSHLFPDFAQVCTKLREDFAAIHAMRMQQEEVRKLDAQKAAKDAEDARVAAAVEAERVRAAAESAKLAAQSAQPAANDQRGKATEADHAGQGTMDQPRAPEASTPPILSREAGNAAVIEAQDDIAEFMANRDFGKASGTVRAALVEFVKFLAARNLKVAA